MHKHYWLAGVILLSALTARAIGNSDTAFRFAHLSDTHIGTKDADADLNRTIHDINADTSIAFVIVSGDITEFGSDVELMQAKSIFDKLNKPWHVVPGNHDTKWSESGGNSFRKIFGSETFDFDYGGYRFIGTNCGPNMRMGPGQVPRENLVWLDSILKVKQRKDLPVFFVNHYPLDSGLNNWYEILDRLNTGTLKAVLCGHGHSNAKLNFEGVPGIMGRSNLHNKDSVGGYNIVTITADSLFYNERKPGLRTLPAWHSISLIADNRYKREKAPKRPDYNVNTVYSNVKEKWSIQEPSDIGSGIAVYKQSIIYTNTGGWVRSVHQSNGKKIWETRTNGKIYATPLVVDDFVIVPSTDGTIYCLNATSGKTVWKFVTDKPIVSSATVYKRMVIVAGSDGHCRAFDIRSGKIAWDHDGLKNFVEMKPLVDSGKVYFATWDNEFFALDAQTGGTIWSWNRDTNRMFSAAACQPVVAGNRLFIVAPDRQMTAFNKNDGTIIWRNYDSLNWCRESMGISNDRTKVYVKTLQGRVLAIDARADVRKIVWTSPINLVFDICPTPLNEQGNYLFVPTHAGGIIALDKNSGKMIWQHKISNCLVNTIHPLNENTLITSSMDGKIVCLAY